MNILYLNSHDTGRSIQPYGHPVETPHLQKLAETGTLFRNAHCAAPTCSPSRSGLLTGQSPHRSGMVGLAHRGGKLLHPERHLAQYLADHGYETVQAGFTHLGKEGLQGYKRKSGLNFKQSAEATDYAVQFLKNYNGNAPFFLDVGYLETHRVEWVSHGFSQEHDDPKDGDGNPATTMPPAIFPDHPDTRRDWLDYCHSAKRLDAYYGQILQALEDAGIAENTLVLATTDHGLPFPGMKCNLTHHGTGVYQIIRFPQNLGAGQVHDALVSHLDFFPTVCELLDVPRPDWLEGHSLLPLVRGESGSVQDEVFAEITFHAAFEPARSIRTAEWCYIRDFTAPRGPILVNCDDGLTKRYLLKHGMADKQVPVEQLYNLIDDPQERNNLADDSTSQEVKEQLSHRLKAWMHQTDDPLLQKLPNFPLPQTVNTFEQIHASGDTCHWNRDDWETLNKW